MEQLGRNVTAAMDRSARSVQGFTEHLSDMGHLAAKLAVARQLTQVADASTILRNQLQLATGSAVEAGAAYERLFAIAQQSRTGFAELGGTFASISRAGQDLGISQARLLDVTAAVGNAMAISGGSAESMKAALTQLGQGLSSGTLRGEELNSVMEQTPRLARALADGLGVTIGELRKMGEEGQLTTERVIGALEKSAPQLAREIDSAAMTFGQAFTVLNNSLVFFTGEMDQASGATRGITSAIVDLADTVKDMSSNVVVLELFRSGTEAIKVVWSDLVFIVRGVATEIGGVAAQIAMIAQGNFAAAGTIRAEMIKDAKAARAALEAYQQGVMTRPAVTTADLGNQAEDARLRRAAAAARAQDTAARTTAREREKEAKEAAKKAESAAAASARETERAYAGLIGKIREKTGEQILEAVAQSSLTAGQREALPLLAQLRDTTAALTDQQKIQIGQALEGLIVAGDEAKAAKDRLALTETIAQANAKAEALADRENERRAQSVQSLIDGNAQLREEIATLGLTTVQAAARNAELEREAIARLELDVLMARNAGATDIEIQQLEQEIALRRERMTLLGDRATREQTVQAAEDARQAFQNESGRISQSLTDALLRGFENGKGGLGGFVDTVKNAFRTLVLRPVVQAIVQPAAGAVLGSLGMGSAQAAGSAGGGGGGMGSMLSAGSSLASMAGLSGAFGSGVSSGLTAWMAGGSVSGSLSAGASMLGSGSGVLAANGVGMMAGTALPVIAAALAIYAISKATKGEKRSGGQYAFDQSTGMARLYSGPSGGEIGGDTVRQSIATTAEGINSLLSAVGSRATLTGFQAGLETSKKGRGGVFSGGTLSTGATFGESGQGSNYAGTLFESTSSQSGNAEEILKNFSADLLQVTIQALQAATDIPEAIRRQVRDVDAESLSQEAAQALVTQINTTVVGVSTLREALKTLPFGNLRVMSFDAADALIQLAGGIDALGANLQTYYKAFFTDAERLAQTTGVVARGLDQVGLSVPATREAFRALVEAQDATTESGRRAVAALLAVAGSADQIYDAQQQALDAAVASQRAYVDAITGTTRAVREEIDRLRGVTGAGAGVSALQARFAVLTAQARAGDASAFEQLPQVSQSLEEAASAMASTSAEVALLRASLAGSLAETTDTLGTLAQQRLADAATQQQSVFAAQLARTIAQQQAAAFANVVEKPDVGWAGPSASGTIGSAARTAAIAEKVDEDPGELFFEEGSLYRRLSNGRIVPAFAAGGLHAGGLRLVGERGPELEVTGPARIFNAAQTRQLLAGRDTDQALVAELAAVRAEIAALRAEAQATAIHTSKTARILDRVARDGESLQVVSA